jgi:hypothetical protein
MILLLRLIFTGIVLFFFVAFFLENIDDRKNSIIYKLYLFIFIFLLQVILNVFNNIFNKEKITINSIMDTAINNALLAVIAYDVYNDLIYEGFYKGYSPYQKIVVLVLLILAFITTVKLLQLLLTQ